MLNRLLFLPITSAMADSNSGTFPVHAQPPTSSIPIHVDAEAFDSVKVK